MVSNFDSNQTFREKLEKEVQLLTEKKQKMRKELRTAKASMSDKSSVYPDMIKLVVSVGILSDVIDQVQPYSTAYYSDYRLLLIFRSFDALSQLAQELPKEAKSSSSLVPLSQKLAPKLKEMSTVMETYSEVLLDSEKSGKEFAKDIEKFHKLCVDNHVTE